MSDISVTDLLDNLREGFLDELPGRIDLIEGEVMAAHDSDSYDELFRMVHSLKGSAGTYNFQLVTKIAHDMEEVMLALMQRQLFSLPSTRDILLKFVDILRDTTETLRESKVPPQDVHERLELLSNEIFAKNISVLVVEPSNVYASLIEFSLESLPIKFTFVSDCLQALENLLIKKYDVLLTSLESPRLNGDAIASAIRLVNNFNKDTEIVLITSLSKDKITNKNDFDSILDRKAVKDGTLYNIVKKKLAN